MTDLKRVLGEANAAVFASLGLPIEHARVTVSDRPDLADFQANGALAVAKAIGRNPREIAADVAARLKADTRFASVEVAGPGFINLRLTNAALTDRANAIAADPRAGAPRVEPRRVLVDYGGPNVAKPMHVGHLRASIIGESLKRLFRFLGDEVLGDAHFGDWGFQMGLLIVAASDENPDWARVAEQDEGEIEGLDLEVLDRLYPLAAGRAKEDKDYRDRARRATAALQSGKPGYRRLWRRFVEVSRTALQREFDDLDVTFDLWKGESDADPFVGPMIEDLVAKGLLVDDDGARVVHVARPGETAKRKHKDGSITISPSPPPLLVVSSEGSAMYGTTDLATIVDRRQGFDPQLMLYVVDERQAEHFEQVFRVAYLAGYAQEKTLEHLGFGTVNGPDGKPFKTREGGVLKLHDLIEMAREKARERLREAGLGAELNPAEFEATAHKVAVAAIKFADLQNFRGASYVFDLDRFTSFEGKTGPYLLYQAVRIKSLLRRAADEGLAPGPIVIAEPAERELALTLDGVDAALSEAYAKRAPNLMAEHAYRLGATFSKFYAACPVLIAPTPELRASRLALASTTLRQMETVLALLGIATPERM